MTWLEENKVSSYCIAKRAKCHSRRCNSMRFDARPAMRNRQTKKDSDTNSELMQLEQLCPPGYSCP